MASLTQTAVLSRKIIRYSIYALVVLIVGRVVLTASIGIFRTFFPPPPPKPTVLFSNLPKIDFPDSAANVQNLNLTLQTTDGGFPKLPTQSKVYFIPKELPTLFSVEQGLALGKKLGFENAGQKVTDTLYRFKHSTLPKTLEINVVTNLFSLSYDLAADPTPIDALPPTQEVAASIVRSYLSGAGLLPADLTGPTSHKYLRIEGGNLVPALSQSDAHLIKINLTRAPLDNLPSLGPNLDTANTWFLVSGSKQEDKKILSGEFHYLPVDTEKASTYPIKTAQEAWQELLAGGGYLAKSPENGDVVVRRIYLANYDPNKFEEYMQPIVVFEGEGFVAYVPAVTSDYYGQ